MDRPNFHFRRREEKLDWKKLAALDVDQIAKTVDYKALQDSIRQITYCDANKEFDSEAADPNLVKVFRMSQLIIEYLLQSQDFLANNLANAEQRLNSTLEELESARERSRRDQEELRDLRKGLRAPASSTVMTLTGHQRCQFCQKVFINTTYLQSHMMRRHNHMVSKQLSNQTLSTVAHEQSSPPATLEAELEQVRRRLLVAEQQLSEERRRVASLQHGSGPYHGSEFEPESPPYHQTIKEEPEPLPEDAVPAGSGQGSRQGSAAGSRQGSGAGSQRGSAGGSQQGSGGGGSQQGSGGGSQRGSGGGSQRGSGGGSQRGSGGGSQQGSGGGSQRGSGGESQHSPGGGSVAGSAGQRDSQLAVLLEQQAAEIRQLREELERQRQTMQQAAAQQAAAAAAPTLLGGPPAGQTPQADPSSRVEEEIQKQTRRDVVALEGQMEAQERYWQSRLSAMRERHDAEVEGMRRMLNEKNAATRGSAEYVNIDSGPERSPQSPRLLRFVHRHQSPSPGAPPPPPPGSGGRGARQRPRPCIAPQTARQRRSRSVSGCRRLKFADDDDECDDEEEPSRRGPPRESLSSDALTRSGAAAGRPQARQELEAELNERLFELGIEPGTRRISSGLMTDKMKHLQLSRQVLGFGDLRRQVDQDLNQRLNKFAALPTKRTSKLALFAKDIMHRGAEMSRSLVSLGGRNRPTCTSATIDAQLMKRMLAAEKGSRPRASSDSPTSGRRQLADPAPGWQRDERDWQGRQHTRYEATSYEEEEDFRPRQGGRKFKFKANASKHILERFTRRGQCQSSLIKSTTIHRVETGGGGGGALDRDGGDPGGRYEKLREDRPPPSRQGSGGSLAVRASAERQPPVSRSGSEPSVPGLQPPGAAADAGFVTPMSRPQSGAGAPDSPRPPPDSPGSPGSPVIPQIGSGSMSPKQESFDTSEMSNRTESSPPPVIPTMDPVDARPSGSANTLSTSQWNSAAAAADSSAADETETRTSHTTGSSSSEEDSEEDEDGSEEEEQRSPPGDQ